MWNLLILVLYNYYICIAYLIYFVICYQFRVVSELLKSAAYLLLLCICACACD